RHGGLPPRPCRQTPRSNSRVDTPKRTARRPGSTSRVKESAESPLSCDYLHVPTQAGAVRRAFVDSLRPARNVVVLLESLVYLGRPTGRGHEQLRPGTVGRGHHEMRGFELAATVGDDGDVVRRRHGRDAPQLGQPAAPVYVRLPDGRRAVLQELPEPVPRVLVL